MSLAEILEGIDRKLQQYHTWNSKDTTPPYPAVPCLSLHFTSTHHPSFHGASGQTIVRAVSVLPLLVWDLQRCGTSYFFKLCGSITCSPLLPSFALSISFIQFRLLGYSTPVILSPLFRAGCTSQTSHTQERGDIDCFSTYSPSHRVPHSALDHNFRYSVIIVTCHFITHVFSLTIFLVASKHHWSLSIGRVRLQHWRG